MRARLHTILLLALCVALPSGGGFAQDSAPPPTVDFGAAAQPPAAVQGVEILYVPRADLPRAPGYAAQGVTLPLKDLLALTRTAQAPDAATSRPLSPVCRALDLHGRISGSAATLQGELEYEVSEAGWSATTISDTAIGWMNQSAPPGAEAFLVQSHGRTLLLARGPAQGRLTVQATIPLIATSDSLSLDCGVLAAPCRIALDLGGRLTPDSANAPLKTQLGDAASSVTLWPVQGRPTSLRLKRRSALTGVSPVKLELNRRLLVVGAGLEVHDRLTLAGRPGAGSWSLDIPAGLRPLNASATGDARVALDPTGDGNRLRVHQAADATSITLAIDSVAPLADGTARLNPYVGPWDAEVAMIELIASDELVPVPDAPPGLIATGGDNRRRSYTAWGALPAFALRLAPALPSIPPTIEQTLSIDPNEASLGVEIVASDPRRNAYSVNIPADWVPVEVRANSGGTAIPLTIQQHDARLWRVSWDPSYRADRLHLSLHRAGAWGAPGKTTVVALPLIGLDGPRPTSHELAVRWAASLDVRPTDLQGVRIAPAQTAIQERKPANLTLRATAPNPSGTLTIGGREPSIRATVVTVLAIEEDRPHVRALINYDVSLAPTHTFRVLLPAGTGNAVRIQDGAIRESTLRPTAQGDEWTIVTQHDVIGRYALQIEWSPEEDSKTAIQAPQIRVPGVTSQEGFVVIEGSETLRLAIETANLVETDAGEVPPLPWPRRNRTLAAFRYVAPPFSLRVKTEKFTPERALAGLVHDARLVTTVSADGRRLTEASYTYAPRGDGQYFDARLPQGASVWSVRVNDQGVHPSRRVDAAGQWLMVPLDSVLGPAAAAPPRVSILYSEEGAPLAGGTRLALDAPSLKEPILRTQWDLNLPPQFEYLTYGGAMSGTTQTRVPFAHYMRTAYYPRRILLPDLGFWAIVILTALGVAGVLLIRVAWRRWKQHKPVVPLGSHFNIVELLIVIAIVAILAAIATPNFLEAQTRSRVSRVMNDQRSIAVAIESYYIDAGRYPANMDELWQGPVKYMTGPIADPFGMMAGKGRPVYHYAAGIEAWSRLTQAGINVGPPTEHLWLVWSDGPDLRDNNAMIAFDPTNGSVSVGDVFRYEGGSPSPRAAGGRIVYDHETLSVGQKRNEESKPSPADEPAAPAQSARGARDAIASRAVKSSQLAPTISDLPDMDHFVSPQSAKPIDNAPMIWNFSESGAGGDKPYIINQALTKQPRRSGLLSMKIDIPVGGVQRSFEALGAESRLRLRLMDEDRYRHLSLVVRMAAFLALGAVWLRRRELYRRVFVGATACFILVPVIFDGAWVVFFNHALEGVLLSLAIPLAARLWRGLTGRNRAVAAALALGWGLSLHGAPARAADLPVRIVVPYDDQGPDLAGNPPAFVSRDDFSRLWLAASPSAPQGVPGRPAIARLELDGALDPAAGVVAGTLRIFAVNSGDNPGTVTLALPELVLENVRAGAAGAALQATADGLVLDLGPHWAGPIEARFKLPCPARGLEGRLRLTLPEAGSGAWRLRVPFAGAVASGRGIVTQAAADATDFTGAVRPGPLDLAWRGAPNRPAGAQPVAGGWRMSLDTTLRWDDLAAACWQSRVRVQAVGSEGRLPRQIQFKLGPGQRLASADGEALAGAAVSSQTLTLDLADVPDATIDLAGLLPASDAKWRPAGPCPLGAVAVTQSIRFEFAEDIDVAAVEPQNLRRVPTLRTTPGRIAQQYESGAPTWSADIELRRRPAIFDERTVLYLRPADGLIDATARVTVAPEASSLHECRIELPTGARALKLEGPAVGGWIQTGRSILVRFVTPVESPCTLTVGAVADLPTTGSELLVEPVRVAGARQARHWAVVQVEPDENLSDVDLAGSRPCPPADLAADLQQIKPDWTSLRDGLRAYELTGTAPVRLGRSPALASARVTVFNRVTIANGLRSLAATVRTEPRRGRIGRIETLLLLDGPDPGAPQRIQASGPVRHVSFEPAGGGALRVITELDAPHADPVEVRFELDQPVSTESGTSIGLTAMVPTGEGDRAFVLLRRAFEGQLDLSDQAASRRIDPAEAAWPADFQLLPTDQTFELAPARRAAPRFKVVRHSRAEALRAVVDALRQRTILTADGIERHELKIILQNQAEQFLRVELPYPRRNIDVYEVQVAGRVVAPIFEPGGKSVLLLPLIRTGLLVPELTVNVAYVARTGRAMDRGGSRSVALPRVLGNVPVLQSSLVLLLPIEYNYSDFEGSLERVEQIDIDTAENLRLQRRLAQVSEAALYTKGETRRQVLSNLTRMQSDAALQMRQSEFLNDAFARQSAKLKGKAAQSPIGQDEKLERERNANLEQAFISNKALASNIAINQLQLEKEQTRQAQQPQVPQPEMVPQQPPTPQPLSFASLGEVFAFRQLQGVGDVRFDFAAREIGEHRRDFGFGVMLVLLVAALAYGSGWLLATPRRVVWFVLVVCAIAIVARAALDATIPGAAACVLALWLLRRKPPRAEPPRPAGAAEPPEPDAL